MPSSNTPEPPPLPVGIAIAALLWLPLGFWFGTNAGHFGWGFLPLILWIVSFPILCIGFGVLAIREKLQENAHLPRFAIWTGLSAIYGLIPAVWFILHLNKFFGH